MQIENLTDLINKTNIRAYVNTTDIVKGKSYDKEKITFKIQIISKVSNLIFIK